ncbi:accessory factor UbiK family protein [Pseudahrensia aquimaris]|uniref:Accessory factor UbiK family protein n=1 Tax=Pseudahrensia aquimaris TaxID=744461 RepID=A0ABW3FD53_9HYPH
MSQGPSRIFDEFAKLLTDATGVAQGARREVETAIKSQGERFLSQMDLVQRDEFEAVKEMASKARMENEALRAELEELKAAMGGAKKAPAKKPAAKKS